VLSLFRTNQIAFNLLLIVYIFLVRASAFFTTVPKENYIGQGVLSDGLHNMVGSNSISALILASILIFLQALLINIIVAKFRLGTSVSLFPGLFYALVASMIPEFLALSPALLANTFFILALWELFETYRKNNIAGHIVNVGFWIGVASLFYFSEVIFLLLAVIGLSVLRAFRLRELIMLLIGFIVPYIISVVYFFWYDQLGDFWQNHVLNGFSFLDFALEANLKSYILLGLFLLLGLIALFSLNSYYAKKNIQAQKNISVLYWALLFAAISAVFQPQLQFYHFLLFMPPLGIFLSFNFLKMKPKFAEALHLLFFISVVIWQFNNLWLN